MLTTRSLLVANGIGREHGLREAALGPMGALAQETGETVHLALLDGLEIVIIEDVESSQVVRIHWPVGTRSPAYASANGKAILAAMPRERVRQHLPAKLRALTSTTITTLKGFDAELDAVVERGYAVQRGEQRTDVASIAAVIGPPGRPVASMSAFLPAHRFPSDHGRLGARVRRAGQEVTAALDVG